MSVAIDIIKYVVQHLPIIALLYAVGTYTMNFVFQSYDQGFIATSLASSTSVQVMNICQIGLYIFIIVAFIMACLNAIATAAAKREALITGNYPGEGIDGGITASIVCFIFIIGAIIINYITTAYIDVGVVTLDNSIPTPPTSIFYVLPQEQTLVNLIHLIPLAILFAGYLYLVLGAFATQVIDYIMEGA